MEFIVTEAMIWVEMPKDYKHLFFFFSCQIDWASAKEAQISNGA